MKPLLIIGGLAGLYWLLMKRQQAASTPGMTVQQLDTAAISAGLTSKKPVQTTQITLGSSASTLIGSGAGVAGASGALASGLSAGTLTPITAVPIVGAIAAGAVIIGTVLFKALNHPFGTCGPNSPDMVTFLHCWQHPVGVKGGNGQIPFFSNSMIGPRGWANFAVCKGAQNADSGQDWLNKNGSFSGCQDWTAAERAVGCNTSTWLSSGGKNGCVAAPKGAVLSLPDGTFVDANGTNLGGVADRP